ncbi:hypothetical protein K450DRAFT_262255 [Umbelopsis ramanniana AG]|uniref:Ribosomal RNA-processing protein 44 n=1 Tax=Umbelopsis ramanniana AG TaxID=1314678 RepID=A0AAD5E0F6_UMBRA|nr:uncharacterized protein K450DRAFT_262255 [Umbelopsis ramanniana AG]KAI8575331.1 hypothetical protein K450DRAFT_262255 [Umbelopsis ramanniana AG]
MSLRAKSFIKRTKKGNVIKVIKEHYLRDDIWCSSALCESCNHTDALLSATPRATESFRTPHYIVPDTNVFMNQIDIMEHPAIKDVIVLQTVREELRHLSMPIYNRVNAIVADKNKRFYAFSNEHHKETYIERMKDESPNDRNDRAIRVSVKWYANHLANGKKKAPITVVMLSDDRDNREKAKSAAIKCSSVRDYVADLTDSPELVDMVVSAKDASEAQAKADGKIEYEEHLSQVQIANGVKNGKFSQGTLNISGHNYLEATVMATVEGKQQNVYIVGRKNMNRSIQGDTVAIQVLPKSEWKKTASVAIEEDEDEATEMKAESENTDGMDVDNALPEMPTAKVVGIIRKKWRPYCGFISKKSIHGTEGSTSAQNVIFRAMDRRIPSIKIRTTQAHTLAGQRIVVAIDSWPTTSVLPLGHFVKTLGSSGDKETETEVLLLEHDVPFQEFSKRILEDLPAEGEDWVVLDKHVHNERRRDFRHLNVCSIDPPGCTDIDDALHVRALPNGNFEVGVHIADVTYFVKPGMPMDEEAAGRGTTVYLVDKRIDMLPSLLGTNLCSLRSNVERLAFSCIWEMNENAEIVNVDFTKSVIKSKFSFTYEEAQNRIDDDRMQDDVTKGIRTLNSFAKKLKQRRLEKGALTLASPEVRFNLENDSQDPVDVELKELKDTNALVEEFMLLANISVAERIYSKFPDSALLRRHPTPPDSNFEELRRALSEFNISLETSTSKELSDSLDRAVIPSDPYFNKMVRIMTTRCMLQAQYFSSGTEAEQDFRHYGLACPIYTHFTSPIRRYSDVMVHRLLEACIDADLTYGQELTDKMRMKELCDNLNFRNRMAQQAARSSVELYTNLFFRNKVVEEDGHVIRILRNGFVVLVQK